MDKQQSLLLKKYVDLLLRWRVLLIVVVLIALPAGLVYYLLAPKVYQASSVLSYQQYSVNPNKISPDLSVRDTVSTLTQIVTSRTNLEELILSLDLYKEERARLPIEDVIETMRKNIRIEPSSKGDIFSITYSSTDTSSVVRVVNALAAKFIEENLKYREERATETSSYTSDELEMAKSILDRKEAAMRDYKLKHYNEMPDQRNANLSRLASLQEQQQAKQVNILELERMRVLIQEQISLRQKAYSSSAVVSSSGSLSYEQLLKMRQRLDALLVTHTENHPEVKRVRKIIENLEAEGASNSRPSSTVVRRSPALDNSLLKLQEQLGKLDIDIETIELEKKHISETIKKYEEWIAAAPVREAEWSSLSREYDQLKGHYDFLVARDLQAKSNLNLERRQKGSQFKIVDQARSPEKPTKPNFLVSIGISIAASLAIGCILIVGIDFLDGSFRDPDDVELFIGLPVLSTIEFIRTPTENRKRVLFSAAVSSLLFTAFVLVATLFWYAWIKGKILF